MREADVVFLQQFGRVWRYDREAAAKLLPTLKLKRFLNILSIVLTPCRRLTGEVRATKIVI